MPKKSWKDLSPRTRRLLLAGGAVEGVLKICALVDLARRPASGVRGPKPAWAAAVILINSAGGAPLAYFLLGRKPSASG